MLTKKIIFSVLFLNLYISVSFAQIKSINVDALVNLMEGSFSSEEQSKNDSDYFDIRLHMKKIWTDRTDGQWLYVEQAVAQTSDKPYRQRIYNVVTTREGRFESIVYTMNEPMRFAGAWKDESLLAGLSPDSLILRSGCSVTLTMMQYGMYEGSTVGSDCESDLRGAKYATSEVKITKESIISWDRGFDNDGNQVWGAEKDGYVFIRLSE